MKSFAPVTAGAVLGFTGLCHADDYSTPKHVQTVRIPADAGLKPSPGTSTAQEAPTNSALPGNTTVLPKTADKVSGGNRWHERVVTIKDGDTLSAILHDLGATPEEIRAVTTVLGSRARGGNLEEGQELRVLLSPVGGTQRLQPVRVMLVRAGSVEAVVALSDLGRYVSVDVAAVSQDVLRRS